MDVHVHPFFGRIERLVLIQVDMAPLAVRKAAYIHIGGMDETTSESGECGEC